MVVSDVYEDEEDDVSEEEVQSRVVPVKEDTIVEKKKAVSCILCMFCMYVCMYVSIEMDCFSLTFAEIFLTENLTC